MAEPLGTLEPDFTSLGSALTVLGSPVRLEILRQLRVPRALGELKVRPRRTDRAGSAQRVMSRQAVQDHLDRLVDEGLVRVEQGVRGGRDVPVYRTDASRVFLLLEDMRALCVFYSRPSTGADHTETIEGTPAPPAVRGPRLVLVLGVHEGKTFALDKAARGADGWTIGRDADVAATLEYDPYISGSHAVITRRRGRWTIRDLASKNGTTVNWVPLMPGGATELQPGDIIGVGRSRLAFVGG